MLPPRLSRRSRRKAGEKAVIARQERASVKEQVALGEIYFFDLFKDERKAIARMKLIDLLQSVPGIGQSRADVILKRTGISPSRRIGGVGHRQLDLLRQEFLLVKNSRKSGKLLVVSGPSGVGKSTITNKLRSDDRFWISISATTRKMRTGEVDGVDYHFVSDEKFDEMIKNNEFRLPTALTRAINARRIIFATRLLVSDCAFRLERRTEMGALNTVIDTKIVTRRASDSISTSPMLNQLLQRVPYLSAHALRE